MSLRKYRPWLRIIALVVCLVFTWTDVVCAHAYLSSSSEVSATLASSSDSVNESKRRALQQGLTTGQPNIILGEMVHQVPRKEREVVGVLWERQEHPLREKLETAFQERDPRLRTPLIDEALHEALKQQLIIEHAKGRDPISLELLKSRFAEFRLILHQVDPSHPESIQEALQK